MRESMNDFEILIVLMTAAILLVSIAQKIRVPYPIALVLGGAALGFIPGLNYTYVDPNLILTIVLPPILYYAAFWTSVREFKKNFKEIASLALSLVIVTTVVIAVIFKFFFPEFPWALAFAFGAIVSPPDAVAATAILKNFSMSSRLVSILEGESLINDASALVLYRLAVTALVTGTFSLVDAGLEFIIIAVGGVLFGIVVGIAIHMLSRRFLDPVLGAVSSFLIPYITYILADQIGVSGVLAVVACGLVASRIVAQHHSSLRRVLGYTTWDLLIILLNCFVFILIGSQLDEMTSRMSLSQVLAYTGYAFLLTIAMFIVRLIWVLLKSAIVYLRMPKDANLAGRTAQILRDGAIVGWAGMRGIVSLTAALALPWTLADGSPLVGREHVIYMVFVVITLTLVLPGLTLPKLVSWLKIPYTPDAEAAIEMRKNLVKAAEEEIGRLHSDRILSDEERQFLSQYFHARFRITSLSKPQNVQHNNLETARQKVVQAQRKVLLQIWERGHIDDKILNLLEHELDVEETSFVKAEI